jgi:hypothetical protein
MKTDVLSIKDYTKPMVSGSKLGEIPRLYARLELPKDLEEQNN